MTALMSELNITTLFYLHLVWPNYGLDVLNITMHTEVVIHSMNAYVWCWSKICGSLDEQDFKGQGHYDKIKSRSYHDAAHL